MNVVSLTCRSFPSTTHPHEKTLNFGDFVADAYRTWGERRAKGYIQLAVKARLVEFRRYHRVVFS